MRLASIYGPCNRKPYILFFSKEPTITRSVQWEGRSWTMYQVTQSCQLTVEGQAPRGKICLCGGGAAGSYSTRDKNGGNGGGGGYMEQFADVLITSGSFVIGAGGNFSSTAGGRTSYASYGASGAGATGAGGSGGGAGGNLSSTCPGDKKSKYPFGRTSLYAHCGGGGGGGYFYDRHSLKQNNRRGGKGGSLGSNGAACENLGEIFGYGGTGGVRGGGNGGVGDQVMDGYLMDRTEPGKNATFYGSGGGGGAACRTAAGIGGNGYQGIAYIMLEE